MTVSNPALEEAKAAWAQTYGGLNSKEIDRRARGLRDIVRGIYRDGAVSAESFAQEFKLAASEAQALFESLADFGMEFDESGNIVGAALTTKKTPHTIRFGDRELYAWCAMDTLFIPGLLGEAAEIESTCPASGEAIRVAVEPQGLTEYSPRGAVLSVVLPRSSGAKTGPASPT